MYHNHCHAEERSIPHSKFFSLSCQKERLLLVECTKSHIECAYICVCVYVCVMAVVSCIVFSWRATGI